MRKTVLITGCGGYIGSVLTGVLLNRGHHVIGIDKLDYGPVGIMPYMGDTNFEFYREDVRNYKYWWKYLGWKTDIVLPIAALVGAPLCENRPDEATSTNFEAVAGLVELAKEHKKIIYFNTNSGYGQTDGKHYCTEDEPLNPVSVYGKTKCQAEEAVLKHPNSASLRLATVFGVSPRMRFDLLVNDFVSQFYQMRDQLYPKKLKLFEPNFKRNYVHIRDVCNAVLHVIDKDLTGIYNLGHPDANLTKAELADVICNSLFIVDGYEIGEGKDPDCRNYLVSNNKILSTGFRFSNTIHKGIKEVTELCQYLTLADFYKMRNV